jgi:hypothetical protein
MNGRQQKRHLFEKSTPATNFSKNEFRPVAFFKLLAIYLKEIIYRFPRKIGATFS